MASNIVRTVTAGALLTIAGCAKSDPPPDGPTENPPPPQEVVEQPEVIETVKDADPLPEEMIHRNPPPPGLDDEPKPVPIQALPKWEDVKSNHPEGATNPPIPVLVVKAEGECYKRWQSPFAARAGVKMQAHVDAECDKLDVGCGTQIECPPEAADLLGGGMEKE